MNGSPILQFGNRSMIIRKPYLLCKSLSFYVMFTFEYDSIWKHGYFLKMHTNVKNHKLPFPRYVIRNFEFYLAIYKKRNGLIHAKNMQQYKNIRENTVFAIFGLPHTGAELKCFWRTKYLFFYKNVCMFLYWIT